MALSSIAAYNVDDPYEKLISSMIAIERQPQFRLKEQQAEQKRLKAVLSDADSKLSALHAVLKRFTDVFNTPFEARSVTVPASGVFSASATDKADFGSHTLSVERLARVDTRVSNQRTASATTLKDFFAVNGGSQTFTIHVASPRDDDPARRVAVSVSVTPTGTTDKEILAELSSAINTAMDQAVEDGLIDSTEKAQASLVTETSDTARLSLRSGQTGFAHRLEFSDSAAGLLSALELNSDSVASGTAGGQITAVGTSDADSELNSKFVLDGLTLYRSTNKIDDALEGVTLSLHKVSTEAEAFSVSPGADAIKTEIKDFIAKYNDVLTFIAKKSAVNVEENARGDFSNDTAFRSLRYDLRNNVAAQVTGQPEGAPAWLSDLGIEINNDGTLKLADEAKLTEAVRRDSTGVQNFFSGPDGIAQRLIRQVDSFVRTNGIIDARQKVFDDHIKRLDTQIKTWDTRLLRREEQLRMQFARLQEAIAIFQGQQQSLFGIYGY